MGTGGGVVGGGGLYQPPAPAQAESHHLFLGVSGLQMPGMTFPSIYSIITSLRSGCTLP